MKYTIKNLSDTKVLISVSLAPGELKKSKDIALRKLGKQVKVAGFRPGKTPPAVVEKNIDKNALNDEVVQQSVNSFTRDIFDEKKITPLDQPKVEIVKFVPDQELEYTVELEVLPGIKLGDYKKLKVKKAEIVVTKEEEAEVIERMRSGMSAKNAVKRPAKNGDEVVMDFDGKKGGKPVVGASGRDIPLGLGSNTYIPGFEAGLIGKKVGDKFDLPLTFPKDYHQKDLSGAKVVFTIEVKAVKEVVVPKLDDEFASRCGPFKTVAELKKDVKRELTEQKEREAANRLKDSLVEQLVKGSEVPVPEVLVSDQIASLERDFVQNLVYRGMTLEDYLKQEGKTKEEWLKSDLRDQAVRRVEVGLALAELSKVEDITATKEELENRLAELIKHYNDPKMQAQLDTPEARQDIANRLITEKTVDRLVELNT